MGGGEFLLGPTAFVRYGLSLLWITLVAAFFQTIFNTELMRYTLATGEPVFTGFMRTKPACSFWAWLYVAMYFLQVGWPYSAGLSAHNSHRRFRRREREARAIKKALCGKLGPPRRSDVLRWLRRRGE